MVRSKKNVNIIIVDDEEDWLNEFKEWIIDAFDYNVEIYNSFSKAEERLSKNIPYDLAIIDIYPEKTYTKNGLELAEFVKKVRNVPVIIVTGTKNDFVKNIRQSFTSIKVNNFFFKKEDTRLHFIKFVSDALKDIDGTASADAEQGKPSRSIDNNKIFIGHGHSSVWRELKDFLQDDLQLEYEEFDRKSVAGKTVTKRLEEMLDDCNFALIILTAEDPHDDGRLHARENVIYELGLFQGRLGMDKAIILLEDGCKEFSNISGQIQIRFSQGNISAVFHKIEKVLKREKII